MQGRQTVKDKKTHFRIIRIVLSLFMPAICGTIIYSIISGLYQEPLFWLVFVTSLPGIFLILLLPSLLYTFIMEYLGKKLFPDVSDSTKSYLKKIIFLVVGTGLFNLYLLISDWSASLDWHLIMALTGFSISFLKLVLHLRGNLKL